MNICLSLVSIIAVSYEARDFGVTRSMRGDDAKEKCPDIELVQVPVARGKANLAPYREAGAEIIEVLSRFCDNCERASVDEAYLDLTDIVDRYLDFSLSGRKKNFLSYLLDTMKIAK